MHDNARLFDRYHSSVQRLSSRRKPDHDTPFICLTSDLTFCYISHFSFLISQYIPYTAWSPDLRQAERQRGTTVDALSEMKLVVGHTSHFSDIHGISTETGDITLYPAKAQLQQQACQSGQGWPLHSRPGPGGQRIRSLRCKCPSWISDPVRFSSHRLF
jgi:hypothetical protein